MCTVPDLASKEHSGGSAVSSPDDDQPAARNSVAHNHRIITDHFDKGIWQP